MTVNENAGAPHFSTAVTPPRLRLPHSFAALAVYTLLIALIGGFGSAYWMTRKAYPLGREKAGAWVYWPGTGLSGTDPYTLAMITRDARLPMGTSEGLELVAETDSTGTPLRSACTYRLGTTAPPARYWTVTVFSRGSGQPVAVDLDRSGFTSREILRQENGEFSIMLSQQARPGNWQQLPREGGFVLVMRLYDVPATGNRTAIEPRSMPQIERLGCTS